MVLLDKPKYKYILFLTNLAFNVDARKDETQLKLHDILKCKNVGSSTYVINLVTTKLPTTLKTKMKQI
jgi:hypothetical protein